ERFGLNVASSKMMVLTNELQRAIDGHADAAAVRDAAERLVVLLAPMAPHITEELWRETLARAESVLHAGWPAWDEALTREDEVTLVVQVDGRAGDRITVSASAGEEECRAAALGSARARAALGDRVVAETIVRPPKLVNLVTRSD